MIRLSRLPLPASLSCVKAVGVAQSEEEAVDADTDGTAAAPLALALALETPVSSSAAPAASSSSSSMTQPECASASPAFRFTPLTGAVALAREAACVPGAMPGTGSGKDATDEAVDAKPLSSLSSLSIGMRTPPLPVPVAVRTAAKPLPFVEEGSTGPVTRTSRLPTLLAVAPDAVDVGEGKTLALALASPGDDSGRNTTSGGGADAP